MFKVFCDDFLLYNPTFPDLKIFDAKLDLEVNKTGGFSFTIYPEHPYFDKLEKLSSIITVYQDDYLLFRGRILNDTQGFYNEKQVSCEGELAFLCDSIQRPWDFMSGDSHTTVKDLFEFFINNHNAQVDEKKKFKIGRVTVTDPNNYIVRSDSTYLNTWNSIGEKLLNTNGGYLNVRHEEDGVYLDYLEDFETISNQTIQFAENLLDINKVIKGEQIASAIIPIGATVSEGSENQAKITIEDLPDDESGDICKKDDYVYSKTAVQKYGWIFKKNEWNDVTQADNLLLKAKELLQTSVNLDVSIELSAFDLSALNADISSFMLGTYIKVYTSPHNLNSNFLVQKLSIDLMNPQSNKLTLGTTYSTFTEQTQSSSSQLGSVVETVEKVENQIAGISGSTGDFEVSIQQLQEQLVSQMSQTSTEILSKVSADYYLKGDAEELIQSISTRFSQTNDSFEFIFNEFTREIGDVISGTDAEFQEIKKYIRFVDGNIILGEDGNQLTLKIQNDRISFLENDVEIAYWQNRKFYAVDGEFLNSLKLGNFSFFPRENGNLSLKKVN